MTYVRPCRLLASAETLVAQGSRIQVCNILQRSDLRRGRSSRLHRRERIETSWRGPRPRPACVPPGFIAGSGLKRVVHQGLPIFRAVPPGFIAGSGLKQTRQQTGSKTAPFLPASSPGAD